MPSNLNHPVCSWPQPKMTRGCVLVSYEERAVATYFQAAYWKFAKIGRLEAFLQRSKSAKRCSSEDKNPMRPLSAMVNNTEMMMVLFEIRG